MSSSGLSEPTDPRRLDPLIQIWERGRPLLRCHDSRFGATELNPGLGGGRFHPLRAASGGDPVPTLYGSNTLDGALSETVFHNLPIRGPGRAIRQATLRSLMLSTLAAHRDLRLAQLHGHGLGRLGLARADLIDCEADHYRRTRRWAEAIYRCQARPDGLVWVSRQHDSSLAIVLFGDRVDRAELEVVEPPLPIAWGPGLEEVQRAAEEAGILVIV